MNEEQFIDEAIVFDNHGLLPHHVVYSQANPSRFPMTARALRNAGYYTVQYRWLHIPTMRSGVSTIWVPVERWAGILVEFWNRIGGSVWKYSL